MKEFDYNKYYAVGTVDVSYQGNNNGQIIVCGYSDGSRFVQLDKQQAKDLFHLKEEFFALILNETIIIIKENLYK